MSDNAQKNTSRPAKACACGCLLMPLLALVLTALVLLYFLSRWDPAQKPWDKLPPGTTWALQAHNCRELLLTATRNPNALPLLRLLDEYIDQKHGAGSGGLSDFLPLYRNFGFLHALVAPNSLLIGGEGTGPDAAFFIFRSPVWLRWLAALPGSGLDAIREEEDESGGSVFFTAKDGWIVAARTRETVLRVLDGWDQQAMPLGAGYEDTDPHLAFAMRRKTENATPDAPPAHFTLSNPFAPRAAPAAPSPAGTERLSLRAVLRPDGDGWRGVGLMDGGGGDDGGESPADAARDIPDDSGAAPYAVKASLRLSPEAREMAFSAIRKAAAKGGTKATPFDSGRRWLEEGWLENAGDEWTALAALPAVNSPDLPYPPLPVFALGWTLRTGVDPAAAAAAFTDLLTRGLGDALGTGGPTLLQNLRDSIAYSLETAPGRPGGDLRLPPVMVNAARPAWRFQTELTPAAGWLATDPAIIPPAGEFSSVAELEQPAAGHAVFACGWDNGNGFMDSLLAVVRDRLSLRLSAPGGEDGGGTERTDMILRALGEAASAYPRGSLHGDCDAEKRRLLFRVDVSGSDQARAGLD